jgi:hypothetical protein
MVIKVILYFFPLDAAELFPVSDALALLSALELEEVPDPELQPTAEPNISTAAKTAANNFFFIIKILPFIY